MAVLGRLKIAPNQRLDLPDIIAFDSYSSGDWKSFLQTMVGDRPFIITGFEVYSPNTVVNTTASSVDITVSSSSLYWPIGEEGSFFVALSTAANVPVTLFTGTTNYIEMTLTLLSGASDARALWDPGANGGVGGEFSQVVDTESYLDVTISANNTGFSSDKIPIAQIVTAAVTGNINSIRDCRSLMFRLGSGGTSPDPSNSFTWLDSPAGYSRTDTPDTMAIITDENAFRGADKNITNLKDWMDAVMSRIKEMDGGPKWFKNSGALGGGSISLANLFLDSQAGHSVQPDRGVTIAWSELSDGKIRSHNAVGYSAPLVWKANFGQLSWALGGTFLTDTRAYDVHTFEKAMADGENLYLKLLRDVALNGDPVVSFLNINSVTASVSSSSTGSFTNIAVGDFIRKASGTAFQYYEVVSLWTTIGVVYTDGTVSGTIADATVQYIVVNTHDGPIATTSEKYLYFRSQYDNTSLIASTYGYYDSSYYWLGRRLGTIFYFRDYGDLQPGEEVEVLNDSDSSGQGGGECSLTLDRAYGSLYEPITNGYYLPGAPGTLLTIRRRVLDNTIGSPSNFDNSNALLTYTIASPIGLMDDGDGIWVRLGTTAGAVTSGDVTDITTDNVWEIRDASDTPLKTYDNLNVFLIARKFTISAVEYLIFSDGTMMSTDGQWINNHLEVQGDLYANANAYLRTKTQWSIPFIGTSGGRVDQNNAEFFWENTGGPSGTGLLAIRNIRISENTTTPGTDIISQDVPQDVQLFSNLGTHQIDIGQAASTVHIPGNLVVDGTSSSINSSVLSIDDPIITLGVGNLSNGGYGDGIEIADDTKTATQIDSYSGQIYVLLTYAGAHSYGLADVFYTKSNVTCGGVTPGQMSQMYTVKASGAATGDAEVMSASTIKIWISGLAATATVNINPIALPDLIRTYKVPSSLRIGGADGTYATMTSWVFRLKGNNTAPTITPVTGYGIVPTASSSNMLAGRIPYVNDDNFGPGGVDSTLEFSANFIWDNANLSLNLVGTASYPPAPGAGIVSIWQDSVTGYLYQRLPDGNVNRLTEITSNVYEEIVDIVSVPSGNNQAAAIGAPPQTVTIPKDTIHKVGVYLKAETTSSSATVLVNKKNHGLIAGNLITVITLSAIGGISSGNLSVTDSAVLASPVPTADTFAYTAGGAASSSTSGYLDVVKSSTFQKTYIVGSKELRIYLRGQMLKRGIDYTEIGTIGAASSTFSQLFATVVGDDLTYRIGEVGDQ